MTKHDLLQGLDFARERARFENGLTREAILRFGKLFDALDAASGNFASAGSRRPVREALEEALAGAELQETCDGWASTLCRLARRYLESSEPPPHH